MMIEHLPFGDPCEVCGNDASRHRKPRIRPGRVKNKVYTYERPLRQERIIGIDGEGQGRSPHLYTFLCACDEFGWSDSVEDEDGLTTRASLDMLLKLPERSLIVGFALTYDFTKILQDLPDKLLYMLFHEKERAFYHKGLKRISYAPIEWQEYRLNYMNRRFTIQKGKRRVTVWDIFRFFACKFTQALTDWKIGTPEVVKAMGEMKDKRHEFDQLSKASVRDYCHSECYNLAHLCRALLNAHNEAGLPLRNFYGAGSTASALLDKLDIKSKLGKLPSIHKVKLEYAIACAFFGGRFENKCIGPVKRKVYGRDIHSAYPYQIYQLPCLVHGKWEYINSCKKNIRQIQAASLALIHWRLPVSRDASHAWAPFPVRATDGTIAFPRAAKGGWCWKQEFLEACKRFPHVEMTEAWLYHTDCDCHPFKEVPKYYLERLKLGKDAKGIVLKLGLNSIYGKLAQSRGMNPPYQNWIWAGNITSGTRAQLLSVLTDDVIMVATDGVFSTEPIKPPPPIETGTSHVEKPLGDWDKKDYDRGMFVMRPGIYFPLDPTEEQLKDVKARGLGKSVLYTQWKRMVDAFESKQPGVRIEGISRFCGAKSSISITHNRSENYGEWIPYSIDVDFNPHPKRERILPDNSLKLWDFFDWESNEYSAALESPDAKLLREFELIADEQPDADFVMHL